ncbi:hypothetical protein C2W62_06230 [Candidatus Entotheonella serta]|nr:hypothetical protein C2W62_06230 [Candidatus Entotheonella serta]
MAEQWHLTGTYFEACNCEVACPCVFLSAPSTGECTVLIAWHIDQGRSGEVPLDGLSVALAVHSPGHMMEVPWKGALYLDDLANEAQQGALTEIFAGQAGGHFARLGAHIGEVLGVKCATMTYEAEGKKRRLHIADIAEAEIQAMAGQGDEEITVNNHPLCVAPGYPAVVARSTRLTYRDHGLEWELSEKNGFYSPFRYEGP